MLNLVGCNTYIGQLAVGQLDTTAPRSQEDKSNLQNLAVLGGVICISMVFTFPVLFLVSSVISQ